MSVCVCVHVYMRIYIPVLNARGGYSIPDLCGVGYSLPTPRPSKAHPGRTPTKFWRTAITDKYTHTYILAYILTYLHACMHTHTHTCMHVNIQIYVYNTHRHSHTHTPHTDTLISPLLTCQDNLTTPYHYMDNTRLEGNIVLWWSWLAVSGIARS